MSSGSESSEEEYADNLGTTTWQDQNSDLPRQPATKQSRRKLTHAEIISRDLKTKVQKERRQALNSDIDALLKTRAEEDAELAKKHAKSLEYIRNRLANMSNYKAKRKPNLYNALLHDAAEANKELPEGQRKHLSDLRKVVAEDPAYQNLSKSQRKEIIEKLSEHRKTIVTGTRSSNAGAAQDFLLTTKRIQEELSNLYSRTGAYSFAMVTRGHVHDTGVPAILSADESLDFFTEILGLNPMDISTKFELWGCSRNKSITPAETLRSMRSDCTQLISNGLRLILKTKNVAMNYANYDLAIVSKYHVKLVGWPPGIPFDNPQTINTIDQIRALRKALQVGSCKWVALSSRQQNEHADMLAAAAEAGKPVGRKRKTRSDAGKKRGRRAKPSGEVESDRSDNEGHERQKCAKKTKKHPTVASQLPPAFKSRERISSDDDEDEQGSSPPA